MAIERERERGTREIERPTSTATCAKRTRETKTKEARGETVRRREKEKDARCWIDRYSPRLSLRALAYSFAYSPSASSVLASIASLSRRRRKVRSVSPLDGSERVFQPLSPLEFVSSRLRAYVPTRTRSQLVDRILLPHRNSLRVFRQSFTVNSSIGFRAQISIDQ